MRTTLGASTRGWYDRTRFMLYVGMSIALAGSLKAQQQERHPDRHNLSRFGSAVEVSRTDTSSRVLELARLARQMRGAVQERSIGSLDDTSEVVFGTIVDVAVRRGRTVVFDRSMQRILLLDRDLRVRSEIGRGGSGPSEFRSPVAIGYESDSVLRAYDASLGLKRFRLPTPDSLGSLLSATPPSVAVMSACLESSDPIVVAPSSLQRGREVIGNVEPLVSILGADNRASRSFGESYVSSSPLVRRIMSEASLGCSPQGLVAVALEKLPFVRIYGREGELLRVWKIRDFTIGYSISEPNERGQPSIGLDPATRRMSTVARIVHAVGSVFIVQVAVSELSANRREFPQVALDTYLMDASSGAATFVSSQLPLVAALDGARLTAFRNDPFPSVMHLRLSPGAER